MRGCTYVQQYDTRNGSPLRLLRVPARYLAGTHLDLPGHRQARRDRYRNLAKRTIYRNHNNIVQIGHLPHLWANPPKGGFVMKCPFYVVTYVTPILVANVSVRYQTVIKLVTHTVDKRQTHDVCFTYDKDHASLPHLQRGLHWPSPWWLLR
jgi:hypothetical protein